MQRVGGVTKARLAGACAAWIGVVALCAVPYWMLTWVALAQPHAGRGRPICPDGLCWAEAASPVGLFAVAAAISGALTLLVCGSILDNGIGRPSRWLVAAFPGAHLLAVFTLLAWSLGKLAEPINLF